ncbi:uncharacterized protein STEHIDRAFT_162223 [Stereum hirsutum FP-91666 SS1]|uniref:uncharacterized protein n=1 Tax=Stereum hirsutum (strain FP-91666) TaxID=721885 RepID=UPI000444A725|nr:uncharacterized protein STEHIDRAFT_162223 [Stereum hirsutum FP-91666 SS1]EIM81238.1 hypothetical protein STEHIDRAFT_162223 [Stereum hirsutum FP-91666 SS1]
MYAVFSALDFAIHSIITNYTNLSAAVLWMLDYVQTLADEIKVGWSNKLTATGALYFLNRYAFGVYLALTLAIASPGSATDARVYALCRRNNVVLYVASTLILARFGVDIWECYLSARISSDGTQYEDFSRCIRDLSDGDLYERGMFRLAFYVFNDDLLASFFCTPAGVASMVLTLAFNAFIFGITVVQTYWHTVEMRKYGQTSVTEILLRDGILYFLVVSAVSVAGVSLHVTSILQGASHNASLLAESLAPYFAVLPNLLINRLFLNLRSWHLPQTYQDSKHVFAKAELPLTHSEGSMGAPLRDSNWYSLNFRNDGHNLESHVMGVEEGSETIMLTRADEYWTSMVPVSRDGEYTGQGNADPTMATFRKSNSK